MDDGLAKFESPQELPYEDDQIDSLWWNSSVNLFQCWEAFRFQEAVLSLLHNFARCLVLRASSFDQGDELRTPTSDLALELTDERLDFDTIWWDSSANFCQGRERSRTATTVRLGALSSAAAGGRSRTRAIWSVGGGRAWRAVLQSDLGTTTRSVSIATTATSTC